MTCDPTGQANPSVSASRARQLQVIEAVTATLGGAGVDAWLFGGWGLDARVGHITRDHGDIEFWVAASDAGRSKSVLTGAGATPLNTQPPTESCEFSWQDADFSTAYFEMRSDGAFSQPRGRWSDWVFPPGSFPSERVVLEGVAVLAMSTAGMLAMKEQYPKLRNGRPLRQKDITDVARLQSLLDRDRRSGTDSRPTVAPADECGP